MEFMDFFSRPEKSWNFVLGHGMLYKMQKKNSTYYYYKTNRNREARNPQIPFKTSIEYVTAPVPSMHSQQKRERDVALW